jgi:hypothetical protein
VCVALMVDWLVVLPLVGAEPSPQAKLYVQGLSFAPGSPKVALSVMGLPAVAVWLAAALTVGATFAIVAVVEAAVLAAPCASVTVSVTV